MRLMQGLWLVAAMLWCSTVMAKFDKCTSGQQPTLTVQTIHIGRDRAPLTPAGPGWINLASSHVHCRMKPYDNVLNWETVSLRAVGEILAVGKVSKSPFPVTYQGKSYQLYYVKSGPLTSWRMGFILRFRHIIRRTPNGLPEGGMPAYQPFTSAMGSAPSAWVQISDFPGQHKSAYIETQVQIHMFLADPVLSSSRTFDISAFTVRTIERQWKTPVALGSYNDIQAKVQVKSIKATCQTQDLTVNLPDRMSYAIPAPHASNSIGFTNFSIQFQNCPLYMKSIQYQFLSVPNQTITDGILPLLSNSTATGVRVQVKHANNTPLKFQHTYTLFENQGPGGSGAGWLTHYSIPLKARLVRYPNTGLITGGSVHAAMQMRVTYK